jgi:hypothetical protein
MRYAIQVLADSKREYQAAARHATRGRTWITVATAGRLVTAERVLARVRTDWINKNAITRIHPLTSGVIR